MGDESTSNAIGGGKVHSQIVLNGVTSMCLLSNVLHVASFAFSLVSVSALAREGLKVQFNSDSAKIIRDEDTFATGTGMGGLYSLDTPAAQSQSDTALVADLQLWHERLGHVHRAGIEQMGRGKVVEGLVIAPDRIESRICEECIMGKMQRTPIPRECSNRASGSYSY